MLFYVGPHGKPAIQCNNTCQGPGLPDALSDMANQYHAVLDRLWDGGTEVDGPLRFILVTSPRIDGLTYFPWAVTDLDPMALALDEGGAIELQLGEGLLTSTALQAQQLRDLRTAYLQSPEGASRNVVYIPVVDADGGCYRLYLRDTIPIEDARGLVRPSP